MNIDEFNKLNHSGQEKAVSGDGILLSNFIVGHQIFDVYKLYSFYVSLTFELGFISESKVTAEINHEEILTLCQFHKSRLD